MDQKKLSTINITKVYRRLLIDHCYLCHAKSDTTLCTFCEAGFALNQFACLLCKRPTYTEHQFICGQCQAMPPPYDVCIAPLRFESLTKSLIHSIKFHQQADYIRPLIELLSRKLIEHYQHIEDWPTQLIFVPSHPKRIKERGFCQTQLMASELYKILRQKLGNRTPSFVKKSVIKKTINTQAQHTLSRKQRLENHKGVYQVEGIIDSHIALFDDVMTSGNTLETCTKQLKKAGATQVDIWVIARTPDKTG